MCVCVCVCVCVRVCVCVCVRVYVCVCVRALFMSVHAFEVVQYGPHMIVWLSKFYSFNKAAMVGIISRCCLRTEECYRNQNVT